MPTLDEVLADLKRDENKEVASLVLHDKALQAVIACWPMVRRSFSGDALPAGATLENCWETVTFDEREVIELSGVSSGLAFSALRRAKGNRLIYPDGTVNQTAKIVLQGIIKRGIS